MMEKLSKLLEKEINTLKQLWEEVMLGYQLIQSILRGDISFGIRFWIYTVIVFTYFFSPWDLIPDSYPIVGHLDDFVVLVLWYIMTSEIRSQNAEYIRIMNEINQGNIDGDEFVYGDIPDIENPLGFDDEPKKMKRVGVVQDCVICMERPANHIVKGSIDEYTYCNHLCLCENCVKNFREHFNRCPICRRKYENIEKIHL